MKVSVNDAALEVWLEDGRELIVPISWFPRLAGADQKQRNNFRLIGRGVGIHWPDLDEDISVENLLETEGELLRYRNGYDPRGEVTDAGGLSSRRAEPEQGDQSPPKGVEKRSGGRDSLERREFI
jgi:hypothetical protein